MARKRDTMSTQPERTAEVERMQSVILDWGKERSAGEAVLLAAIPKSQPKSLVKAETIREHLNEMPNKEGHEYIKELCSSNGISLDNPWPPYISEIADKYKSAVIVEFPSLFGDDTRAVSNTMARCPAFAAVKERQHFRDYVLVGIVNGTKIEFSGEQLNQDDHDTFMQLVKMAEHRPFGAEVWQSVNSVLGGLGRHTRQEQRKQLFEQIDRLVRGTFRVTAPRSPTVTFHLIDMAITPMDQGVEPRHRRHLSYRLNKEVERFYNKNAFSLFDIQQRLRLRGRGSELAKALHLWIIGNAKQYAIKVETLRDKLGSRDKTLRSFRQKLRQALDMLKAEEVISAWSIDGDDLVHIDRTPTETQQRYLDTQEPEK